MAVHICTECKKPVVKSILRGALIAFYNFKGEETKTCPHCSAELYPQLSQQTITAH